MSETKPTPGPWTWVHRTMGNYHDLVAANGVIVHTDGSASGEYRPDIDVNGPDASLIAAAPDLLEALRANHEWHLMYDDYDSYRGSELWTKNTEAIAKAKGVETPPNPADVQRFQNEVRAAIEGEK